MRSIAALFAAVLLTAFSPFGVAAQTTEPADAFPSRLIRIVVPYPAGGATDAVTRKIADRLHQRLNWTIVVDNRPGANTVIGTEAVAKAPADGYTLLLNAPGGIVQLPWMQENLPYDPLKDLQPLIMVARVPVALITPATLPANNFAEFVKYVKGNPGKLAYGSLGLGSTGHIFGEALKQELGLDAVHVPYRGDAPAMTDLVPGRIQYLFNNTAAAANHAKQGTVKVMAVTGDRRVPALADVPTLSELGLPQFDLIGWFAFFTPAGVPRPILEKLYAEFQEAVRSPEVAEFLNTQALIPDGTGLDQFAQQVRNEHAAWGKLIKAYDIKMD